MIKKVIKKVIGEKNIEKIRRKREVRQLINRELLYENKDELDELVLRNVIMAHSIEKSMAIVDVHSLINLSRYESVINNSISLIELGYSKNGYAIRMPLSSVKKAVCFCLINSVSTDRKSMQEIMKKVDKIQNRYNLVLDKNCGISIQTANDLQIGKNFDWFHFSSTRHSIRKFAEGIVEKEVIIKIIDEAKYYPSACNRQPCKVYYSTSKETNQDIATYVNDSRTVKEGIHNFFIVTCDRRCFMKGELFQSYINGGIYLGYLVLSIHAQGLGACIFQNIQNSKKDMELHKRFNIPDHENILAFVGYGYFDEEVRVLCAPRKLVEEVSIDLDN